MKNFKLFIFITLTIVLGSCQPDPVNPLNQDYRNGVLVVNEGPFQTGTGTLSFAHFKRTASDSTYAFLDVFQTVNGRVMGNIAQSAVRVGGYVLVAVNLAGTVELLDAKTMQLEHTFTGLGLPRYFQALPNNRVALSDWQDNRIYVLDLTTKTVVDTGRRAGRDGLFAQHPQRRRSAGGVFRRLCGQQHRGGFERPNEPNQNLHGRRSTAFFCARPQRYVVAAQPRKAGLDHPRKRHARKPLPD
jgi:hypothetical protein